MSLTNKISKKKNTKVNITLGGIAIVIVISAGVLVGINDQKDLNTSTNSSIINIFEVSAWTQYKDGKYTAVGKYDSPEGEVSINLDITITNNNIEEVTISPKEGTIGKTYQEMFAKDAPKVVKGKRLDSQFDLTRVNGSSLTGIGFRNALEKIKKDASKH